MKKQNRKDKIGLEKKQEESEMGYRETYESWLNNPYFDEATRAELQAIAGNEKEIEERFYMDLEFGTAGLRGVIGAGTDTGTGELYLQSGSTGKRCCHRV